MIVKLKIMKINLMIFILTNIATTNRESEITNSNREITNSNREITNSNREITNSNREMPPQTLLPSGFHFYINYIYYINNIIYINPPPFFY